ncbi:hypothetical protein BJ684DRAFT_20474 [Piptocephalis cylindrospora]|uniref:BRCT domain-containing protein n=1 Tax=Piptocephalis cylindrospora TaxID=1907219 RepID=A0A4P9Y2G1_9FUNG|nr:hypothetical protein BJ684DRAFT_20474 [Piptocephalis cylindrospora]|eukprot:RKP13015.1 hypothetical protein BJ684DRAFT_20474 [Piptocephalis cylindrospora]
MSVTFDDSSLPGSLEGIGRELTCADPTLNPPRIGKHWFKPTKRCDLLTKAVSSLKDSPKPTLTRQTYARRPQDRRRGRLSMQRPSVGPLFPEGTVPTMEGLEMLRAWEREVELELEALAKADADGSETEGSETEEHDTKEPHIKTSGMKRPCPSDGLEEHVTARKRMNEEPGTEITDDRHVQNESFAEKEFSSSQGESSSSQKGTPPSQKSTAYTWCFLMTGLSEEQVSIVKRAVSNLHARIIPGPSDTPVPVRVKVTKNFSPSVTHLITTPSSRPRTQGHRLCRRTVKYLSCLAAGIWIVDVAWAEEALRTGHWTLPDGYEMDGDDKSTPRQAPRLSRLTPAPAPRLLSGHVFWLDTSTLLPSLLPFYTQIIRLAGGRVTQIRAVATTLLSTASPSAPPSGTRTVPPEWLLDSLSRWKEESLVATE